MVWCGIQLLQRTIEPKATFHHKNMPVSGKDVNFIRLMIERNEETERLGIGIHFHILWRFYKTFLWGFLFGVLFLLWLVLAVVGWFYMCSVVLHQHLSLLKEWFSGVSKPSVFKQFLSLRRSLKLLKTFFLGDSTLVLQGKKMNFGTCPFRRTKGWKDSSVRLTQIFLMYLFTTCLCFLCY